MVDVTVTACSHGDGWLSVDSQEWIAARARPAPALTDDLCEWMDAHGHQGPTAEVVTLWATSRTGQGTAGLYGDGPCWEINTCNVDTILSDDLGFVVFAAGGELGNLVVVISDYHGWYCTPDVYYDTTMDTAEWADYASAGGECSNGHTWYTSDGHHLYADYHRPVHAQLTISGQARVPFGDTSRAYIACPDCGKAIRFLA